jgi:hypothetical protein
MRWPQAAQATRPSAASLTIKMLAQRQNKVVPTSSIRSLSTKPRAAFRYRRMIFSRRTRGDHEGTADFDE